MFVNDDIYYFESDMTENEKRKEGNYLMTCFVIHVSLISLHNFYKKQLFYKKSLSFTTQLQIWAWHQLVFY